MAAMAEEQPAERAADRAAEAKTPCYHVKDVEGKGLGVVAVRDIVAGEQIIEEAPRDKHFKGPICSTLNHSCSPNCQLTLNETENVLTLYACADITLGEELCHQYVDVRQPREKRLEDLLKPNPGGGQFKCLCPVCVAASAESDRRRKEMSDMKLMASSEKDLRSKIQHLDKLLSLYDEEGLHLPRERKMASYFAFNVALKLEDFAEAAKWLEQAHRYASLGCGEDHADTKMLLSYVERMRRSPNEAPF